MEIDRGSTIKECMTVGGKKVFPVMSVCLEMLSLRVMKLGSCVCDDITFEFFIFCLFIALGFGGIAI